MKINEKEAEDGHFFKKKPMVREGVVERDLVMAKQKITICVSTTADMSMLCFSLFTISVTRKKSPNLYESWPKRISLEK